MVPKCGKLFVHFLRDGAEYANQFHNVVFDHKNNLSHEALYARFAWTLLKTVKELNFDSKVFNILEPKENSDDEGPSGGGDDGEDDVEEGDSDDGDDSGTHQPSRRQWDPDALTLQSDSWLYDMLHKMAPGDDQSSLKADEREIEDDLMRAARDHPFLGAHKGNGYEYVLNDII